MNAHYQSSPRTAAGPVIPAKAETSFAATQAVWRFLSNERVTPAALVKPLRECVKTQIGNDTEYTLAIIDWSKIDYDKHTAKNDTTQLTHAYDVGHELTTQLLVDAKTGRPIAPIQTHIKTANGYLTTAETPVPKTHRLDQVAPLMTEAKTMGFNTKLVHIIDREADSVWHMRQWHSEGNLFIVRGKDRCVTWRGESLSYPEVETKLVAEGVFERSRDVTIRGQKGIQYVAEASVVLERPAARTGSGKLVMVPGAPLTLRLVIARVVDAKTGELMCSWYLLGNLLSDVSSATIALWYYYRWEIESYFKLMKSGGQELEHWQQESGVAILKRLLVASMACATVWALQGLECAEATELKQVLCRLSGKSRKRGRSPTPGVLLSGLFTLLRILDFLDNIDSDLTKIAHLKTLLQKFTTS